MNLHIDGKAVKDLRIHNLWTVDELAAKAGLSTSAIYEIERNVNRAFRITTIRKLASALGCDPDTFVSREVAR